MSALRDILKRQIRQSGALSVAEYMALCLSHPRHGYYMKRDPFGEAGDFITAPEISQMFGEMLGLWMARAWMDQGAPGRFLLAEIGPGRGTLMADMLRATSGVAGFHEAAEIWLVETSPTLAGAQKAALRERDAHWAGDLSGLPEAPLFLVANEFFDALPVRQFVKDRTRWRERTVGLHGERLVFGLSPAFGMPILDRRYPTARDGDLVEYSPAGEAVASEIGRRIHAGGAALVIDYGDWNGYGDTFQAVRRHEKTDPLAAPGDADLTAHVNFSALAAALRPATVHAMTTQGRFLETLGMTERANSLAATADPRDAETIARQHRRLTHPDEMGNLFKVIAATTKGAPPPPGFS
ncbi:MAG: class I SAM-dependent methyltransferase [Paracoccaceae bacterium]